MASKTYTDTELQQHYNNLLQSYYVVLSNLDNSDSKQVENNTLQYTNDINTLQHTIDTMNGKQYSIVQLKQQLSKLQQIYKQKQIIAHKYNTFNNDNRQSIDDSKTDE